MEKSNEETIKWLDKIQFNVFPMLVYLSEGTITFDKEDFDMILTIKSIIYKEDNE